MGGRCGRLLRKLELPVGRKALAKRNFDAQISRIRRSPKTESMRTWFRVLPVVLCLCWFPCVEAVRPYHSDLRCRAVYMYWDGATTVSQIARTLHVHRTTVSRWLARYFRTGDVGYTPWARGRKLSFGVPPKLTFLPTPSQGTKFY